MKGRKRHSSKPPPWLWEIAAVAAAAVLMFGGSGKEAPSRDVPPLPASIEVETEIPSDKPAEHALEQKAPEKAAPAASGASASEGGEPERAPEAGTAEPVREDGGEEPGEIQDFVLNSGSKKFHKPDCSSVKTISAGHYEAFSGSRDEVLARGYEPCKRCRP